MITDYLFDRREAYVKRWHTELTIRPESLAEHQFFVARNAQLVAHTLTQIDEWVGGDGIYMDRLMFIALHHDEAEKVMGDTPGNFKRSHPTFVTALKDTERAALQELVWKQPKPLEYFEWLMDDSIEKQIVKYCDTLDILIVASREVDMGNYTLKEAEKLSRQWLQEMDWPWLKALREKEHIP